MNKLTKKRIAAITIDAVVAGIASLGVEYILRKKIKSEFVHNVLTPTATMWALEYVQLRTTGQTIGYKAMGLTLASENDTALTDSQIAKRILYRDTVSTIDYIQDRAHFDEQDGASFPHDRFSGTVVKEV